VTITAPARTPAWPGLDSVPSGPRARIAAYVARQLVQQVTQSVGVHLASKADHLDRSALERPTLVLHRPEEFCARLGHDGLIGFGEAFMTGAWDSPDLDRLLTLLARDLPTLVPDWLQRFRKLYVAREPRRHRSSVANSRANIAQHYDLSNELFETFLDPSMSYSSALFDDPTEPLETAQHRKIDRILDQLRVRPGTRLLEIGTGWGELAIRASARGATVRSVTLSVEQQAMARSRIRAAGLADRVEVELLDYRQVTGSFDAIASVEMIEAVGHLYWPAYFETLDALVAPGGRVCIQGITMPHDRMLATRGGHTWINKYIFPGGFLPSMEVIDHLTREHTRLRVVDRHMFGADYAETLRRWDTGFLNAAGRVRELGFDEVFIRMWHFYLAYSRAGFASGYLDVGQFTLTRNGPR
jgi:cyclopropane-fatty-acyl-phospholipid synthase